jgi:hypothetical protein
MLYVTALPNGGATGPHPELFSDDPAAVEQFARAWDRPGMSVYVCANPLVAGAQRRGLEQVQHLERIILDIDFKDLEETPEAIDTGLAQLPLQPSRIVNSGGGRHVIFELREPIPRDTTEFADACQLWKKLASQLSADPAVTFPHALHRQPGTTNSKREPHVVCSVLQEGSPVDITELQTLVELLGDSELFSRKPKPQTNGHDTHSTWGDERVDVDARLAAMEYGADGDAGINATYTAVIPSMLRTGTHPDEVLERCVDAAMAAAARAGLQWDRAAEVRRVASSILSAYRNVLMRDYDPATGEVPSWLPGEFHEAWVAGLAAGGQPRISRNPQGFFVGVWKAKNSNSNNSAGSTKTSSSKTSSRTTFILRPFEPFNLMTLPPRSWLYGKHYQRGTVSMTAAPGGFGKTTLDLVEMVAMTTGRNLLGEQPEERVRGWIHNGEDTVDELNRRLGAICLHYGIPQEELKDWLFITTGTEVPLHVANGYRDLKLDRPLIERITEEIQRNRIDVATFDPLVTLHRVHERDTGAMDAVVRVFAGIADTTGCSVELSHHTSTAERR